MHLDANDLVSTNADVPKCGAAPVACSESLNGGMRGHSTGPRHATYRDTRDADEIRGAPE
jgi:hypothetical protein